MNFDAKSLIANLIFSGIGFVYFAYGKKMKEFNFMACGMGLMIYSYFFDALGWIIGIGLLIAAYPFVRR